MEEIVALKESGNELFRSNMYKDAIVEYTKAIALASVCDDRKLLGTLYSNRSNCYLQEKMYSRAEIDAREALSLDSTSIKSIYRLSKALFCQERYSDAVVVARNGLEIESSNGSLKQIKVACDKKIRDKILNSGCPCDRVSCSSFVFQSLSFCGSCGEVSNITSSNVDQNHSLNSNITSVEYSLALGALKGVIKRIIKGDQATSKSAMNPTFQKLDAKASFLSTAYPGISHESCSHLPQSLRGLLGWKELKLDLNTIAGRASQIFLNVKARGSEEGEVMDKTTETYLIQQIVEEQLARDILKAIGQYGRLMSSVNAALSLSLASPSSELASWDQLDPSMEQAILNCGYFVQEEFMGSDWKDLIIKDVVRFEKVEKLMALDQQSPCPYFQEISSNDSVKGTFLDLDYIKDRYPALSELVSQLHALPYELNLKLHSKFQLLEPSKGTTMLIKFPVGSGQVRRFDNHEKKNEEDNVIDSLIRITLSYNMCIDQDSAAVASDSACSCFLFASDGQSDRVVDIHSDQLVGYRSTWLENERAVTTRSYFSIVQYLHGKCFGQ